MRLTTVGCPSETFLRFKTRRLRRAWVLRVRHDPDPDAVGERQIVTALKLVILQRLEDTGAEKNIWLL